MWSRPEIVVYWAHLTFYRIASCNKLILPAGGVHKLGVHSRHLNTRLKIDANLISSSGESGTSKACYHCNDVGQRPPTSLCGH